MILALSVTVRKIRYLFKTPEHFSVPLYGLIPHVCRANPYAAVTVQGTVNNHRFFRFAVTGNIQHLILIPFKVPVAPGENGSGRIFKPEEIHAPVSQTESTELYRLEIPKLFTSASNFTPALQSGHSSARTYIKSPSTSAVKIEVIGRPPHRVPAEKTAQIPSGIPP